MEEDVEEEEGRERKDGSGCYSFRASCVQLSLGVRRG